jgi:hypothetical protein
LYWKASAYVIAHKNGSIFPTFSFHCLTSLLPPLIFQNGFIGIIFVACVAFFFSKSASIFFYSSMQRLKLFGDFEIICVYWLLGCVGSC